MIVKISAQLERDGADKQFCDQAGTAAYYIRRDERGTHLLRRLADGAPMNINGLSAIISALADARFNYETMATSQGYDALGSARRDEFLKRAGLLIEISQEIEILLDELQTIEAEVNQPETYNDLVCAA